MVAAVGIMTDRTHVYADPQPADGSALFLIDCNGMRLTLPPFQPFHTARIISSSI